MSIITANVLKAGIGNNGSGLGYGCMGITAFYGPSMDDNDAIKLLQTVYDSGVRHFDTAERYYQNDKYNESIIGTFLKGLGKPRDSYTIATKYWPNGTEADYEYDTVKTSLLHSLERLQLDYVDVYYAHRTLSLAGGKTFVLSCKRLKEEGLIKTIGLSEVNGKWLEEIYNVYPVDAIQQEWSIMTRSIEADLVQVCKKLNIIIVAYSPLARNLLTKINDTPPQDGFRKTQPRYLQENFDANQRLVTIVDGIAKNYNCSVAEISLAWLFNKAINEYNVTIIPIPGSTRIANVLCNNGSVNITISYDDMITLDSLASQVAGERGSDWYMANSFETQK